MPGSAEWEGGTSKAREFPSAAAAERAYYQLLQEPGVHDVAVDKKTVMWKVGGTKKSKAGLSSLRTVAHEESFPTYKEAMRFVEKLERQPDVISVRVSQPTGSRSMPSFQLLWKDQHGYWRQERFATRDDAEDRARYVAAHERGTDISVTEKAPVLRRKEADVQTARMESVKHRLTERLPFLVIYTTDKGPLSRSFETEAKAKQWAVDFTERKGYTTAVYALTREGKKLPLGYYKPNDGTPVSQDPVAAKAEADAKAAPAVVAVPTVAPPPPVAAAATPNLRESVRLSPSGIPMVRGRRWGHARPPKQYRRMGARHPGDYAYPERFMYPLYFHDASGKLNVRKSRQHTANAKSRFSQNKHTYPAAIRQMIARNINKAARRLGLEADVRP